MGLADALVARIDKLIRDRLDAVISSRLAASDYTAPDNIGIGNIKAKTDLIPAAGPASAANYTATRAAALDLLDVAISLVKAKTDLIPAAGPASAANYTATRAAALDLLDVAISLVKAKTDLIPAAGPPSATDYSASRALKLDNLDAAVSSRMGGTYKDPDTTALSNTPTAGALTDLVRAIEKRAISSPVSGSIGDKLSNLDAAVSSRPSGADYSTARAAKLDNLDAASSAIKAKTDLIPSAGIKSEVTLISSGTLAADGTEQTLRSETTTGRFQLLIDVSAMAGSDVVELRCKTKFTSGGSLRTVWYAVVEAADVTTDNSGYISQPLPSDVQADWTLKQLAGTNRSFPWKLMRL